MTAVLSVNKRTSSICQSVYFDVSHIRSALADDMAAALAVTLVQSRLYYSSSII